MSVIEVKDLSILYRDVTALRDISFSVERGEYIALVGPNGGGKSTLLRSILGIIPPTLGSISLLPGLSFGYVAQTPFPENPFSLSVKEVLQMGLSRTSLLPQGSELELLLEKLALLGFDASFLHRSFHQLSGGQRQRVIIARALLHGPDVLLLDEPLSGVDQKTTHQIYTLLSDLHADRGTTILLVSHDESQIRQYANRVLHLHTTLHENRPNANSSHIHP